jgi:hypothetical protein
MRRGGWVQVNTLTKKYFIDCSTTKPLLQKENYYKITSKTQITILLPTVDIVFVLMILSKYIFFF